MRDLYTTIAQVTPVLLLALVWESRYLDRIRASTRPSRRQDPTGGYFWTKQRIRVWTLLITMIVVGEIGVSVAVLGGLIPDHPVTRGAVLVGLALVLGSLATRASVDIVAGTRDKPPPP